MNFKILIVGNGNEGKSSFIQRHKTGAFDRLDNDQESALLKFTTNHGPVTLEVKTNNHYENEHEVQEHDAEIIMFDLTRPSSMKIVDDIPNTNKPRVVVGNKCDLRDEIKITDEEKRERIVSKGYQYYDISAKSNYNYDKPFLFLLRKLVDEDLTFVEVTDTTKRETQIRELLMKNPELREKCIEGIHKTVSNLAAFACFDLFQKYEPADGEIIKKVIKELYCKC